jgi:hypothetical protein
MAERESAVQKACTRHTSSSRLPAAGCCAIDSSLKQINLESHILLRSGRCSFVSTVSSSIAFCPCIPSKLINILHKCYECAIECLVGCSMCYATFPPPPSYAPACDLSAPVLSELLFLDSLFAASRRSFFCFPLTLHVRPMSPPCVLLAIPCDLLSLLPVFVQ